MTENTRPQDIKVSLNLPGVLDRAELEALVRAELKTVHHKRMMAVKLGLPWKVAYDMKPITVIHWILDKYISDGQATGQLMGVSSEAGADDNKDTFDQFTQKLAMFIENGWAVMPNKGEGIDMNRMQPPPPAPNGATGPAAPAPTPAMAPGMPPAPPPIPSAVAAPQAPQPNYPAPQAPQPGYQQPPVAGAPTIPGPPAPVGQGPAPMPPPNAPPVPGAPAGAPPAAQTAPPTPAPVPPAPPAAPPPPVAAAPQAPAPQAPQAPQPQAPAPAPQQAQAPAPQQPQAPAPTGGGAPTVLIKAQPDREWGKPGDPARKRRKKFEIKEDEAWEDAGKPNNVQALTIEQAQEQGYTVDNDMRISASAPAAQAPQAQPPAPAAPQAQAAPQPQSAMMVPPNPLTGATTMAPPAPGPQPGQAPPATAAAPSVNLSPIEARLAKIETGLAVLLRATYQRQGEPSLESVFSELGIPLPQ